MRKSRLLRTERDLAGALDNVLRADPDLSWRITRVEHGRDKADAVIHLKIDGRDLAFLAELKLKPTFDLIETLAHRATPKNHAWLLVTPHLTDRFVTLCRQAGVACLDLNGRVWIRRGAVLIDRAARPDSEPIRATPPPPDIFSPKSSRVVRALLSPRTEWSQADLSAKAGISRPLLSRLLDTLLEQGYVRREGSRRGGRWLVSQPDALLDEWARRDVWSRRVTLRQYSVLIPPEDAARALAEVMPPRRLAFTQWFAAQHRHVYTDAPVVSAYVENLPTPDLLKNLSAREVASGGRLWLIEPHDEGVFQFTQTADELPLVSDAQIYLDLLPVGQRGPDAADALRRWEGFRR